MIGDLRTVMRRYMRLVESSDPYVYHVTPAEPLSARGLIQRYGGREVEFRNLAPLAEQAIRTRAAEHLDPGAQPQIKPKMRIGYASFRWKRCSKRCWQQYSAKALRSRRSPKPSRVSVMLTRQVMLKCGRSNLTRMIIGDGSHRFHCYVRAGLKVVLAIYRVS